MTGSNLAPIVIPIVVMLSLGAWIALVFHAASHPRWRQRTAPAPKTAPAAHDSQVPARSVSSSRVVSGRVRRGPAVRVHSL